MEVSPPRPNPVPVDGYTDEIDRIARETARDAYRAAAILLDAGQSGPMEFGVQHVGGRILIRVEIVG